MDQQPHGNFVAFLNRSKEPGDNKPTFDGRMAVPGGEELRLALWAHEFKNGRTGETQIMFNGQTDGVALGASALDQVAALMKEAPQGEASIGNLKLAARQIVLFPNGFKDEAPDKKRPDYWGAYNPGNGEPIVRISVWAKKDRNQHALLAGATSYPIPGKTEEQQQDAIAGVEQLIEQGVVTRGTGKARGGKGRDGTRA